ncbi:hypothetical protein EVA_18587 [gut metagenome]|uniref:Uncharacterized protein n=1 Tax=gut metagenome TaxID=749906 RepID=J9FUP7_9ZZZZ
MIPTITPIREERIVGLTIRFRSSLVISPLSFTLRASKCIPFIFSDFARISTNANKPIRQIAKSSPRYNLGIPKVKRS